MAPDLPPEGQPAQVEPIAPAATLGTMADVMHPLDTAVVSVYLLLTLALGLHLARRVRSSEDLFLVSRVIPRRGGHARMER